MRDTLLSSTSVTPDATMIPVAQIRLEFIDRIDTF